MRRLLVYTTVLATVLGVAGYALASAGLEATPTPTPTPAPTIPPGDPVSVEQMREWYPCPYDVEEFPESCEVYAVLWLGWPGLYAEKPEPTPIPTPTPASTPAAPAPMSLPQTGAG